MPDYKTRAPAQLHPQAPPQCHCAQRRTHRKRRCKHSVRTRHLRPQAHPLCLQASHHSSEMRVLWGRRRQARIRRLESEELGTQKSSTEVSTAAYEPGISSVSTRCACSKPGRNEAAPRRPVACKQASAKLPVVESSANAGQTGAWSRLSCKSSHAQGSRRACGWLVTQDTQHQVNGQQSGECNMPSPHCSHSAAACYAPQVYHPRSRHEPIIWTLKALGARISGAHGGEQSATHCTGQTFASSLWLLYSMADMLSASICPGGSSARAAQPLHTACASMLTPVHRDPLLSCPCAFTSGRAHQSGTPQMTSLLVCTKPKAPPARSKNAAHERPTSEVAGDKPAGGNSARRIEGGISAHHFWRDGCDPAKNSVCAQRQQSLL